MAKPNYSKQMQDAKPGTKAFGDRAALRRAKLQTDTVRAAERATEHPAIAAAMAARRKREGR